MVETLRKRSKIDYKELDDASVILSTSNWKRKDSNDLKIVCRDVEQEVMFGNQICLNEDSKKLVVSDWINGEWLSIKDIEALNEHPKVKTFLIKVKAVYDARSQIKEIYVDGFMDTMLHILGFDDYPCLVYPQYEYSAIIGEDEHIINARTDFSVVTKSYRMLIVIEDKTMNNAAYSNNWKEDQVLGELFVAIHNVVRTNYPIQYPIEIYAVRVVGTLFTFYKTAATVDYIRESAKGIPEHYSMEVQRHPTVEDDPSRLTAYDICNREDRYKILECMSAIKRKLLNGDFF
jgi:hypothetical protein